jgi:hypothetical protein
LRIPGKPKRLSEKTLRRFQSLVADRTSPHTPFAAEPLHEPPKSRKQILRPHENPLDFFMRMLSHEIHLGIFIK